MSVLEVVTISSGTFVGLATVAGVTIRVMWQMAKRAERKSNA